MSTGIYDLLEVEVHQNGIDGTRYAENDYFADAVCLTDEGKIQAKAIGEFLRKLISCRNYIHKSKLQSQTNSGKYFWAL